MTATPSTAARPHLKLRADGRIEPMLLSPERAAGLAAYREARAARAAAAARDPAPSVPAEQPRPGRRTSVQPHHVLQLVELQRAGASQCAAARQVGISKQAAGRVLSGQSRVAHHPQVRAAGVVLPDPTRPKYVRNPQIDPGAPETPPVIPT
ncbi:MAG: hypothetical protein MUF16_00210 [Burkholderiaceae bacterium]|jgi:hypothetical protein|nr:hypothetical protein [Burkholderiaceae bacterium]